NYRGAGAGTGRRPLAARPGLQADGDRGGELATGLQVVLPGCADQGEGWGNLLPAQRAGDPLDRRERAGGVVVPVDVDAVGQSDGGVEAGVVDGVEEVLESAGHVADVGRRPEQDAVGGEQVRRTGRQGRP